ncbi:hypothetical protein [Planctobacterium marinum]|uniref:Uncharacterized protein n=1 Tax=Planctobacterium marinum TaxID=1631968 RepID=A0AA48HJ10_9ALTE|nr:hypothetical protein MACH26_16950 [Planctobacterium marinum]
MKYEMFGIVLFAFTSAPLAQTNERYTVVVSEIANMLTQPPAPEGTYNRFLSTLDNIEVVFMPPARVAIEFPKNYLNCIFPASTETMPNKQLLLESSPLEVAYAYLFTLEEQRRDELNANSKIAIRRGFTYGGIRRSLSANYIELDDDATVLQFLNLKRVDAVISYLADIQGAAENLKFPMPHFQKYTPIYAAREAFVCHDNSRNKIFIEQVNDAIQKWKARY